MQEYERITNRHEIGPWGELVADDATYWFTTGSYSGRDAIVAAVAHNFDVIRDEDYRISDVEWVAGGEDFAVARYRFAWTGLRDGKPASGSGRGTNVLVKRSGRWQMAHECEAQARCALMPLTALSCR